MAITAVKKWHPGHYIQDKSRSSSDPADLAIALSPGFTGAVVDLAWADLEPQRGQYDFTTLIKYLSWAETNGRQIAFIIYDRDFSTAPAKSQIIPKWLVNAGLTAPFQRNNPGGVAKIWLPEVTAMRAELLAAIAAHFDDHPNLEAVALPETALGGINEKTQNDYTVAGYTKETLAIIAAGAQSFARTQLWYNINYAPGDMLDQMAAKMETTGAGGLTNPDTPPWDEKPGYAIMRAASGRIAVAIGGNTEQLDQPGGKYYATMAELIEKQYQFNLGLGANYMLWAPTFRSTVASGGTLTKDYRAALLDLVARGWATVGDVPLSLRREDGPTDPPTEPAIDVAALRALVVEAEDWLARLRTLVGE